MKFRKALWLATLSCFFCSPDELSAEYTLILKNGRRITVQSYREEGGMIKFQGLGGEIGISKSQIQSIVGAGEKERGMVVKSGADEKPAAAVDGEAARVPAATDKKGDSEGAAQSGDKPLEIKDTPSSEKVQGKAKEEQEYQKRLKQINDELKAARERYSLATRGTTSQEPGLLTSEEVIRARTDDLNSRLRDAQYNPQGPSNAGGLRLTSPSPFAGQPPSVSETRPGAASPRVDSPLPPYSEQEKELSELRGRVNELQGTRERLIEEMRRKNLDTGALFLD
jgi:hypothetical protein